MSADRACRPDSGSFGDWAEYVYFRAQPALDSLVFHVRQFHAAGGAYDEGTLRFVARLVRELSAVKDGRDLRNAMGVVLADLIALNAEANNGVVNVKRFGSDWGPLAGETLAHLAGEKEFGDHLSRPWNPVTVNELIRFVSAFAPRRCDEFLNRWAIPSTLPLIESVRSEFGEADSSIECLVGVQHLFGSTVALVRSLAGARVSPDGVFLLGKPYSTNHATLWHLRGAGFFVHDGSHVYDGAEEHHREADAAIDDLLSRASLWLLSSGSSEARALLLDDGGRAIVRLHEKKFESVRGRFVCVEQTRRGVRELADLRLEVPVVNVAESWAKLDYESPIIAESVVHELQTQLDALADAGVMVRHRALVVGYGAIGVAVGEALIDAGWEVGAHDSRPDRNALASENGLAVEPDLSEALPRYGAIIGCSGEAVLDEKHCHLMEDSTVLVSASSSDIEFTGWRLRAIANLFSHRHRQVDEFNLVHERFGDRLLCLGDTDHPCHFLYILRIDGRRIFLTNGGFPINMNGEVDPIPAERIQLTRSLLYAGGVQASRSRAPGLIPLDDEMQRHIIAGFTPHG